MKRPGEGKFGVRAKFVFLSAAGLDDEGLEVGLAGARVEHLGGGMDFAAALSSCIFVRKCFLIFGGFVLG